MLEGTNHGSLSFHPNKLQIAESAFLSPGNQLFVVTSRVKDKKPFRSIHDIKFSYFVKWLLYF